MIEPRQHVVQFVEDRDIGVEIKHPVVAFRQQVGQHVALYRGAGLHQVVLENPRLKARDGQARRVDNPVERRQFGAEIHPVRRGVNDAGVDHPVRMRRAQ